MDCSDLCLNDPNKTAPTICGCGVPDTDTDSDATPDCIDTDDDNDEVLDVDDAFPQNATEAVDTDADGIGDNSDTDDDNDGVSDEMEVICPNGGDSNNDGFFDHLQNNVACFQAFNLKDVIIVEAPIGTILGNCKAADNPSYSDTPSDINFDYGFIAFSISGISAGGGTTITMTLPSGATPNSYYKYSKTPANQTDHWYEFLYDSETGAEINANIITLHFTDALRGDDMLTQDSMIIDLGAPGFAAEVDDGNDGGGGGGGGCFIDNLRY